MASTNQKNISFWGIVFSDLVLFYASLWISINIRYKGGLPAAETAAHYQIFTVIFLIWLVVFFIHGLFEIDVFRRYTKLLFNLVSAMVVNLLVAVIYFYFQPNLILTPRRFLLIQVAVAFVLILIWHLILKYLIKNRFVQGVYLFSFNNELAELEKEISAQPYLGFRVLGHLNEQTLGAAAFNKSVGIILPENLQAKPEVLDKFYQLRTEGVRFYNHKDFYEQLLRRVYLSQINEIWFLENISYQEKRLYNISK
jgi:hypothetical protein